MNCLRITMLALALIGSVCSMTTQFQQERNVAFDPSFGKDLVKMDSGEAFLNNLDAGKHFFFRTNKL